MGFYFYRKLYKVILKVLKISVIDIKEITLVSVS